MPINEYNNSRYCIGMHNNRCNIALFILLGCVGYPKTEVPRPKSTNVPFKMLENIQQFILACQQFGIPEEHIFIPTGIPLTHSYVHNVQYIKKL
jgi:hypothetical protein